MKKETKRKLIERFSEPSTWRGVVAIATAFGLALTPEQQGAIITIGLTMMGLIGVGTTDKK